MALPKEQIDQIKQQIIDHIKSSFPEEKKASSIEQIKSMNESQLEEFLIQNNLIKAQAPSEGQTQCIFCSIVKGEIPSYKIFENQNAIAVLEINPISRGHTMIIPKPHVQEVSSETQEFAKETSAKLKEKLNAKEMQIKESEMFGHKVLNIIPIYDDETLKGERQQAPKEVLESLQKELEIKEDETQKPEEPKKPEVISDKDNWLPKRIP